MANRQINIASIYSTISTKFTLFYTSYIYLHINAHLYFHYPNQHDLPNWTFAYSTIEIGHRTLDPPASNRKSVLIPIVKIRISTLPITYKCCYNSVRKLFFCTFQDRNALNMRRLRELVDGLDGLRDVVANFRKALNVPHQGRWIARHVDHFLRCHLAGRLNQ